MHLYRKFHARGGVRRVYATADKNWDRVDEWDRWEGPSGGLCWGKHALVVYLDWRLMLNMSISEVI